MQIPIYETEILWGRRGKVITVYTVDGASDKEFSEFYDALGEAVSECYCELIPSTIQKLEYINDYGEQPRTVVDEWLVKVDRSNGKMTFTLETQDND
jgi:predicted Ser/Thr protein kinase